VTLHLADKDGLELVHAGVCEEQRWVVERHHRRRVDSRVLALGEEFEEGLSRREE